LAFYRCRSRRENGGGFRIEVGRTHTVGMEDLSDDVLVHLTVALVAVLRATTGWDEPARLYALLAAGSWPRCRDVVRAGGRRWWMLAEGDPYEILDAARLTEDDAAAVALAACGRSVPDRTRTRTVTVVTPDRRQCTAIERSGDPDIVVDCDGEGPLLRALAGVWAEAAWRPPAA
jgi:hypothetical protein